MKYRAKNGVTTLSLGALTVAMNKDGTVPANTPQSFINYWLNMGVLEPVQPKPVQPKPIKQVDEDNSEEK